MSKRVITISREFGSGGRTIGRMVAEALGVPFYDKKLIAMVAEESGFSLDFVEESGENYTTSLLFNLAMGSVYGHNAYAAENIPPTDRVNILQSRIIKEIAQKEPCVIVGRSADYILRERDDCFNVFVHARMDKKLERAVNDYGISQKDAEKEIQHRDRARATHYRHYTGRVWGMSMNYHLTLDSGAFSIEACRDIIVDLAKR